MTSRMRGARRGGEEAGLRMRGSLRLVSSPPRFFEDRTERLSILREGAWFSEQAPPPTYQAPTAGDLKRGAWPPPLPFSVGCPSLEGGGVVSITGSAPCQSPSAVELGRGAWPFLSRARRLRPFHLRRGAWSLSGLRPCPAPSAGVLRRWRGLCVGHAPSRRHWLAILEGA